MSCHSSHLQKQEILSFYCLTVEGSCPSIPSIINIILLQGMRAEGETVAARCLYDPNIILLLMKTKVII